MSGNPDPVNSISGIATNDDVSKSDFIAFEKGNLRRFASVSEVATYDLYGRFAVLVNGYTYIADTADTITQPDGTKTIVDANGIRFKRVAPDMVVSRITVRAATTANITIATALNNGSILDGVTLATGVPVLVKDQPNKYENGIYIVGAVPVRSTSYDTFDKHVGALVVVSAGTANIGTSWYGTVNAGGVLGTDSIIFTKLSGVSSNRSITGTDGLQGGGDLTTDRTIRLTHIGAQPDPFPTIPHKPTVYTNWAAMHWLDDRWSVTRSTTRMRATRKGLLSSAAINAPAFHTLYATGDSGLSSEPGRTNLFTRSEDLSHSDWTKANATVSTDTAVAPDGATTADKVTATAVAGTHGIYQLKSKAASAITYTNSVFVKAAGLANMRLLLEGSVSGNASCYFNLTTGTAAAATTSGGFSAASSGIEALPDGWYRCWLTATSNTDTGLFADIYLASSAPNSSFTGNGTDGLYVWGAQLEAGAYPTIYIPTTSATVTRSADDIRRDNSDGVINPLEGTLFVEGIAPTVWSGGPTQSLFIMTSSDGLEVIGFRYTSATGTLQVVVVSAGVATVALTKVLTPGASFKAAFSWDASSAILVVNNDAGQTDSSVTPLPAVDRFCVGSVNGSGGHGWLQKKGGYWPRKLTLAQLQTVTT